MDKRDENRRKNRLESPIVGEKMRRRKTWRKKEREEKKCWRRIWDEESRKKFEQCIGRLKREVTRVGKRKNEKKKWIKKVLKKVEKEKESKDKKKDGERSVKE